MKFYRHRGSPHPAVLWNPATEQPVYEFVQGCFETEDPEIIGLMQAMGFATEPISINIQQAMNITADLSQPQPPPPPPEHLVPAEEPKTIRRK